MNLKSIRKNAKNITFAAEYNADTENVEAKEERKVTCQEMPNPEFGEALQALTTVVVDVMSLPKDWVVGMAIAGFSVSYTKQGTKSMQIIFDKALDKMGGISHRMNSPMFRIDEPADGEDGSVEIEQKSVTACHSAIREAELYAKGNRSQQTFDQHLEEMKALANSGDDDEQQEKLIV